jgi:uncharacterized membrane protein
MSFSDVVEFAGKCIDGAGVAVIVAGSVIASGFYLLRPRPDELAAFRLYRQRLGRVILLGLEFLVAGDIIRTVAISPTFRSVGILAVIVLIRSFLSFTLELEISGRWPWQRGDTPSLSPPGEA